MSGPALSDYRVQVEDNTKRLLGLSLEWWLLLKISENFSNQGVTIYGLLKGTAGPTVFIYLLSSKAHLNEVSKPKANPHVEAIYKTNENSVRFLWPVKAWENTQSSHGLFGVGFWLVEKSVQLRATNKSCTISKKVCHQFKIALRTII